MCLLAAVGCSRDRIVMSRRKDIKRWFCCLVGTDCLLLDDDMVLELLAVFTET